MALNGSLRRPARYAAIKGALRHVRIVSRPGDGPVVNPPALHIGTYTSQITLALAAQPSKSRGLPMSTWSSAPPKTDGRGRGGWRNPDHARLLHEAPDGGLEVLRSVRLRVELLPELVLTDTLAGVVAVAAIAPWIHLASTTTDLRLHG